MAIAFTSGKCSSTIRSRTCSDIFFRRMDTRCTRIFLRPFSGFLEESSGVPDSLKGANLVPLDLQDKIRIINGVVLSGVFQDGTRFRWEQGGVSKAAALSGGAI